MARIEAEAEWKFQVNLSEREFSDVMCALQHYVDDDTLGEYTRGNCREILSTMQAIAARTAEDYYKNHDNESTRK